MLEGAIKTRLAKMIIDTSAIIAILRDEPEAPFCTRAIAEASNRRVTSYPRVAGWTGMLWFPLRSAGHERPMYTE